MCDISTGDLDTESLSVQPISLARAVTAWMKKREVAIQDKGSYPHRHSVKNNFFIISSCALASFPIHTYTCILIDFVSLGSRLVLWVEVRTQLEETRLHRCMLFCVLLVVLPPWFPSYSYSFSLSLALSVLQLFNLYSFWSFSQRSAKIFLSL